MKKVLLSILLTLLPLLASAETVEIDGIWYNLVPKAKEAEVTWNPNLSQLFGNYSGSIEIPTSVTYNDVKFSVTSIGYRAFSYCYDLTSITIPNSVTTIGDDALWHCTNLNSVAIPNSVKSIGFRAFMGCSNLTTVTISNSLTSIGGSVFYDCSSLTSITIPNSVTSIGNRAFYCCSGLTSVTIPNSVTNINSYAFYNCRGLTSVTIPNSVTTIGDYVFSGCSGLTSISIPCSVTTVGGNAFMACIGLTSVTIGSGVNSIGEQAFANCDELSDVYCLATKLRNEKWSGEGFYTPTDAFKDSYPQAMTLHVPAAYIEAYRSTEPWSLFKAIVALEDGDHPEIKKCATPEICYADGKLDFTCETEGVDFISEVTVEDSKKYYDASVTLSQTYKVIVYATKAGYENSDVATREIVVEKDQTTLFGDLNKDGKVNVADHVRLSDIIMNK